MSLRRLFIAVLVTFAIAMTTVGGYLAWREASTALEAELARLALLAYQALECRDFARADFRLDAQGRAQFLEMNPLPTFAPDGSFGILAELEGRPLEELLAEIIADGLCRLGLS